MSKSFNFSGAGPAVIFSPEVLHKAQAELTNWFGQGVSVMEVSHRGEIFYGIDYQAEKICAKCITFRYLIVLFLQGGARGQLRHYR